MKVLITGGSHVVALNQGFKNLVASGEIPASLDFHVRPLGGGLSIAGEFFRARSDHVEITDPKFRSKFKRLPPLGRSYDVVVLCTALYSRPVWNKADWAVYGVPGLSEGRLLVSDSMLRRAISDDNKHLISFLKHLRTFGIAVCVVEGPRPFRHNIEVARAGIDLVKHIDSIYRSLTVEKFTKDNISVIFVPDSAFDKDGFMLEKYRHKNPKDRTHGSADFGKVMMREIVRFMQHFESRARS